jgi:hypothetical protein
MSDWTPRLTQLNDVLGELEPREESIRRIIRDAGLKESMIPFNGSALDIWSNVIDEARKRNKVDNLVNSALKKHPGNDFLISAIDSEEINYSISPRLDDVSEWKGVDPDTLEVLTMKENSMLPISFLARGIICSRSVAKVELRRSTVVEVGTGFLCRLKRDAPLYFITNFHVINNKEDIPFTRIIFDYEEDINGDLKASKSYSVNPDGPWFVSPVTQLDVCVCQLIEEEGLTDYAHLPLQKVAVNKNDFVNIIQHPGGQLKKIALYHNIVTHTTDRVVQYLTDTLKGSSGAPVFNSNWDVVALHHSGGVSRGNEPRQPDTKYRNEGIQINQIIDFITEQETQN